MLCDLKNKDGWCCIGKKECDILSDNIEGCPYYIRQHPKDKKVFENKVKKALSRALLKRDVYKNQDIKGILEGVDFTQSIFNTVQNILKDLKKPQLVIRERRKPTGDDLTGNVLKNLTQNLYSDMNIEILQRRDKVNSIIIKMDEDKYLCKIKVDLDTFFKTLKTRKDQAKYYKSQIVERTKLI